MPVRMRMGFAQLYLVNFDGLESSLEEEGLRKS